VTIDPTVDCFVCRKQHGEIAEPGGAILQERFVRAGHMIAPDGAETVYLGWLLVEPRRHAPGWADLTADEAHAVGWATTRLARALMRAAGAEHVYSFVLGHHVPHLHVHVVPRYPGTPPEYWGLRVDEWPDAPTGSAEAVEDLAERLRTALEDEREA
jgi:diadenosine tetraphosphate (Ap4A) HIT family hydrolase